MNLEVEREEGELAKLRRLKERVMALRDEWRPTTPERIWDGYNDALNDCAADIDEALKEVGSE